MKSKDKKLTKAEYWEWRTTIAEMQTFNEKNKLAEEQLKSLHKDIDLAKIMASLHIATKIKISTESLYNARSEYNKFKAALEKKLGISLNNKVINDVTFAVNDLE